MTPQTSIRRDLLRWNGWFLALQSLVLTGIALRYLTVGDWPAGVPGNLFGLAMYVGHFISVTALLFLPLLLVTLAWPRRRLILGAGTGLAFLTALVLLIDTFVFQQYRFHINSVILSLVFSSAAEDVFVFSTKMFVLTVLGLLVLAAIQTALALGVWRVVVQPGRLRGAGYGLAAVFTLIFVSQNLGYAYFDASGHSPVMRASRLLPVYEPLTAKGFLDEHGFDVVEGTRTVTASSNQSMDYPLMPLGTSESGERPNILFVTIESWRFDVISDKITPNIQQFANRNLEFTHHFSGGNSSRTGLFSLFYGLPGTYWHSALNGGERPALIDILAEKNYEFFVSSSADLTTPPFHRILFRGIDGLRVTPEGDTPLERDRTTTQNARQFLRQAHDQPFFGFVFLDAPHNYSVPNNETAPFQPSWDNVNYMALGPDFDPTPFFNRYKNAVHFADSQAGKILDTLRKQSLLKNTIVVITADHGQEFNDLGLNYWGHNGNFARYQTRVPLVVHWPNRASGRIDYITSHMDVAPTILDRAFGAEQAYQHASVGADLFQSGGRLPLVLSKYRQYAAVNKDRIVVFRPWGTTEVRNKRFRRLENAQPAAALLNTTLKRISRFYGGDGDDKTTARTNGSQPPG